MNHPLLKRAVAESFGTALLLAAVVGSGIMGERLAAGNTAIALLANRTIVAQLAGAFAATTLLAWLSPSVRKDAASVVMPHEGTSHE